MLKREIASTFAGNLLAAVLGLGASVIIARTLGREGQGLFALAWFLPSILANFSTLGQDAVNATFAGVHKEERKALFVQSLLVSLISGILGSLVTASFFFWLPIDRGEFARLTPEIVWVACLSIPVLVLANTLGALVRGVGRITTAALVPVILAGMQLLLVILFLAVLHCGLSVAVLLSALAPLVGVGLSVWILRDYATVRLSELSSRLLKKSLFFGAQVSLATLAMFLVYRVNQGILGYMVSAEEIGVFVIAVGLADRLRMIPGALGTAFLPRLANELAERQSQVPAVFRYSTVLSVGSMLAVGAAGAPLILLLYGWEYAGAIVPFFILLPGVAALGGASVLSSDLLTRGKPYYAAGVGWCNLALNVLLNLLLIPVLGIAGAALTSTMNYVLACILAMLFYHRESHVPFREMAPRWADCVYVWSGSWAMVREVLGWIFGRRKTAAPASPGPADPSGKG